MCAPQYGLCNLGLAHEDIQHPVGEHWNHHWPALVIQDMGSWQRTQCNHGACAAGQCMMQKHHYQAVHKSCQVHQRWSDRSGAGSSEKTSAEVDETRK